LSEDITAGIVRILSGRSVGTGFVVSDDGLLVTCAHVLGSPCPERVSIIFLTTNEQREATVEMQWLRDVDTEDMAILRVQGGLPQGVRSLSLGSSTGVSGHKISTFGFPSAGEVEGVSGYGKILGRGSQTKAGQPLLQIRSSEITQGFSGAPVWDELRGRVIGMVVMVATPDASGKMGETAFATPVETLQRVCRDLQISDSNPYCGLNPFTEAQAKFFFGRKQVVDRLVNKLRLDPRFLLILGPSGSGKSSLVQAGLIPQLRNGVLPGSDRWHIMLTRPADTPFQQLAAQGLATESNNLTQVVREWLNQYPERTQIVLVLDQFEELLVHCPEEMSQDFLAQLTALLDANLPSTVIAIMREDFYPHFAQQVKLARRLEQNGGLIRISPTLQWDELAAIVQEPARVVGLRFEEGLAEEIVEDSIESETSEEEGRVGRCAILPLLEFALTELCERREDGVLTFKAYEKVGGVTGGLRQWADQTFNSLEDASKKQLASRIFSDLVYLGNENKDLPDTRRRRALQSLYRNEDEREDMSKLVQRLVNARLLVTSYDPSSGQVAVEIIHDALLREWGLLKWWLKRDGPFLRWHQELERRAQAWVETNPNETRYIDRLLRGSSLSESEGWMELRAADLSGVEQKFIKASREQQNQEDLRWKALYEKVEQQRQEAVRQREEAEKQRQEAVRQREEAEKQRAESERQRQEAERQRRIALARQLTAQAELLRGQQGHLLQRSVLLAIEALQRSPSLEADQALRYGFSLLPRPITRLAPRRDLTASALSSDGRYLVRATRDNNLGVWDVSSGRQLHSLFAETGVKYVVFSQDARCFAAVGTDSTVHVWETSSGRQVARLVNSGNVISVTLSRDARYLVATSGEGIAWAWEIVTNRAPGRLAHEDLIRAVTFSSDGSYLATASVDGTARVWETIGARQLACLNHERSVSALAFSPDGDHLATVSDDYCVRLWPWRSGSSSQPALLSHEYPVNALTFHPGGNYIATASQDHTARIWEMSSGRQVTRMNHQGSITAIVFASDGRYLATTSADRTVGVWETESGYQLICLPHKDVDYRDGNYISNIAFDADGRSLATASENGSAGMWEIITGRLTHKRRVSAVAFSPDGRYLATGSEDGTAGIWEVKSGYRHLQLCCGSKVWAVAFSPDGRSLATGSADGMVGLWETIADREPVRMAHKRSVNDLAFSPDGRSLATASDDKTAKVWETASGRLLFSLSHSDTVNAVAFSPDGRSLATASNDTNACVWEVATGRQMAYLPHKLIVNKVVFSPDGRYLATASWDHTAKIWETSSGRELFRLPHRSKVWSVVFSPAGISPTDALVATASKDHTARVWETSSGKQIARFTHDDSVSALAFSPDGKYLATASDDHTTGVWEIASGRQCAYLPHGDSVNGVVFSPDGKYLATASVDGLARLWLWRSEDLLIEAQGRLTRNLTQAEWQQYLGEEPYRRTRPDLPEEAYTENVPL
jgi:WD40 repeat protein/ABC-type Fe3+/spermidine/putrescine transport system ATPase subunit